MRLIGRRHMRKVYREPTYLGGRLDGARGIEGSDQPLPGGQGGGFATVAHPQLGQDVGDVAVDGAGTDEQLRGNLRIGQVLAEKSQDFLLAEGEINVGWRRLPA